MAVGPPSHYDRAMSLVETMAIVEIVVQGTLAMLLGVVWRALGSRWALLLLAGFVAISAQYVCVAVGHYNVNVAWADSPKALNAAFSLVGHGLITVALMAYTGVPAPWSRRLQALTATVFGVALLALAPGWLNRGMAIGLICVAMCAWAALFAWAMLREPYAGHGIVMLAVLVYPVSMAAAALGWLSTVGAGISLIVPHAVLGMTILTTGLVRAHKQSARELLARQAVQQELERTNQTLEQRVAMRTAQLRETIEGLESFNRSVSHDLRGPLGGITGVATLARAALARGDLPKADTLITAIARQSRASTELVASLLQLAHSAERPLERVRVPAEPLVREVVDALLGTLDEASSLSSPQTQVVVASPLPGRAGRPGTAAPGVHQPARQWHEIQPRVGRATRRGRRVALSGRGRCLPRARQRRGPVARAGARAVRAVPAPACPQVRRPRHRPDDRSAHRRAARRPPVGGRRGGAGRGVLLHAGQRGRG